VHVGAVVHTPVRSVPAATRRHWKVTPDCRLAENAKVAVVSTVTSSGVASIEAAKLPSATDHV
jgi:hypothetical protein